MFVPTKLLQLTTFAIEERAKSLCHRTCSYASSFAFKFVMSFFKTTLQSPGKYKALADCRKRGSEDLLIRNGDVIQLLHEDAEGRW